MDIVGKGKRVRIYFGEHDKAAGHHEPLWEMILNYLRQEGAAGATLFRGLAGFGAHSKLHTARLADLMPDLAVVVEWIDGPERVERLLPHVCELVPTGTITLEEVDIVKYTHRAPRPVPPDRVGEVMTREVVTVHPDTPLGEVVRMLIDRDFRALPVVDQDGQLVGIITNRDLVERGGLSARIELLGALAGAALERELADSLVSWIEPICSATCGMLNKRAERLRNQFLIARPGWRPAHPRSARYPRWRLLAQAWTGPADKRRSTAMRPVRRR